MSQEDQDLLMSLAAAARRFLWVYPYGTRATIIRAERALREEMNRLESSVSVPFPDGIESEGNDDGKRL